MLSIGVELERKVQQLWEFPQPAALLGKPVGTGW